MLLEFLAYYSSVYLSSFPSPIVDRYAPGAYSGESRLQVFRPSPAYLVEFILSAEIGHDL